jgi:hypothetical protein
MVMKEKQEETDNEHYLGSCDENAGFWTEWTRLHRTSNGRQVGAFNQRWAASETKENTKATTNKGNGTFGTRQSTAVNSDVPSLASAIRK